MNLRTLYVYRPLLNAAEIAAWAKEQGFESCLPPGDMHVTVCYSKTPVDWDKTEPQYQDLGVWPPMWWPEDPSNRVHLWQVEQFDDGATVLRFRSHELEARHEQLKHLGATSDYDEYQPHVTLTYQGAPDNVVPYDGELHFGPERFEEIEGWADDVVEKAEWDEAKHPRGEDGKFGEGSGGNDTVQGIPKQEFFNALSAREYGRQEGDEVVLGAIKLRDGKIISEDTAHVNLVDKLSAEDQAYVEEHGEKALGFVMRGKFISLHEYEQALQSNSSDPDEQADAQQYFDDLYGDRIKKIKARIRKMMTASDVHVDVPMGGKRPKKRKKPMDDNYAKVCKVDSSLGIVLGWAIVCKTNGKPYFDLQRNDDGEPEPDHIPEDVMLKAASEFMGSARTGKAMHDGESVGTILFAWPMTTEIAKAMGIETQQTGLMIGYKPNDPAVLAKFRSGEYSGFSIGGQGKRIVAEDVV